MPLCQRSALARDCVELFLGRQPVRGLGGEPRLGLALQTGDAHHVELVEVVGEDGEELRSLEQRHLLAFGEGEHAGVEFEPRELTVQEAARSAGGLLAPSVDDPAWATSATASASWRSPEAGSLLQGGLCLEAAFARCSLRAVKWFRAPEAIYTPLRLVHQTVTGRSGEEVVKAPLHNPARNNPPTTHQRPPYRATRSGENL